MRTETKKLNSLKLFPCVVIVICGITLTKEVLYTTSYRTELFTKFSSNELDNQTLDSSDFQRIAVSQTPKDPTSVFALERSKRFEEVKRCNEENKKCGGKLVKGFARLCVDDIPLTKTTWEWHKFGDSSVEISNTSKKKLLIAQYSAFGKDTKMFERLVPMNKEYAKRWGYDIIVLQDWASNLSDCMNCSIQEEYLESNKLDLLRIALSKEEYDQLLILDTGTLICDFSLDVTTLVPEDVLLVIQRTSEENSSSNIERATSSVTLWNLQHPYTQKIATNLEEMSQNGIPCNEQNRDYRNDLDRVIGLAKRESAILFVEEEFDNLKGTVIKNFQSAESTSWDDGYDMKNQERRILELIVDICSRFEIDFDQLYPLNYISITTELEHAMARNQTEDPTSINGSKNDSIRDNANCTKEPSDWSIYPSQPLENPKNQSGKRLLIAQYSGNGMYLDLLEMTAPINLEYSKRWGHDMIMVKGTAFVLTTDDPCNIAPEQAMHNKLPILIFALSQRNKYDQVLILDADAMIVDLGVDITSLLKDPQFLAAQRVNQTDTEHTWNINNGITLWNLNHPMTKKVAKKWFQLTVYDLTKAQRKGLKAHGDQNFLHRVLRREKGATKQMAALSHEFRYYNGTVVKHFVRFNHDWDGGGLSARKRSIEEVIANICKTFHLDYTDVLNQLTFAKSETINLSRSMENAVNKIRYNAEKDG